MPFDSQPGNRKRMINSISSSIHVGIGNIMWMIPKGFDNQGFDL